jgi:hypothetical protein
MHYEFLDPTSNMRVNTGPEFRLALKGINDCEIPGIDVASMAMSLVTRNTRTVTLVVYDTERRMHTITVKPAPHSVFNVQERASDKINRLIPVRIWLNEIPVAGYRASRNGIEIPMHNPDFIPYKLVVEGIDTNDVQAVTSAIWSIEPIVKHIELCMGSFTVKRTHIRDTRFRMTTKSNHRVNMTVRAINTA